MYTQWVLLENGYPIFGENIYGIIRFFKVIFINSIRFSQWLLCDKRHLANNEHIWSKKKPIDGLIINRIISHIIRKLGNHSLLYCFIGLYIGIKLIYKKMKVMEVDEIHSTYSESYGIRLWMRAMNLPWLVSFRRPFRNCWKLLMNFAGCHLRK